MSGKGKQTWAERTEEEKTEVKTEKDFIDVKGKGKKENEQEEITKNNNSLGFISRDNKKIDIFASPTKTNKDIHFVRLTDGTTIWKAFVDNEMLNTIVSSIGKLPYKVSFFPYSDKNEDGSYWHSMDNFETMDLNNNNSSSSSSNSNATDSSSVSSKKVDPRENLSFQDKALTFLNFLKNPKIIASLSDRDVQKIKSILEQLCLMLQKVNKGELTINHSPYDNFGTTPILSINPEIATKTIVPQLLFLSGKEGEGETRLEIFSKAVSSFKQALEDRKSNEQKINEKRSQLLSNIPLF